MPAVMDFRSPFKSAYPQNPTSESHSSFCLGSNGLSDTMGPSSVEGASACGAFSSPKVFQTGYEKSNVSSRSKPRLVKVRRQMGTQQGRLGFTPNRIDPGFNPFRAMPEGSDQVNDGRGKSNPFSNLNGEVKCDNEGFVFSANRNDSMGSLNAEKREFNEKVGKFGPDDEANVKIVGGAGSGNHGKVTDGIGVTWADSALKSESEKREFGGNVGFVYGANQKPSAPIFNVEKSEGSENVGNFTFDSSCGFSYGTNPTKPVAKSKEGKFGSNVKQLPSDCRDGVKSEVKAEDSKYGNIGFVFGASLRDSVSNLKPGNAKSSKNVGNCIFEDWGKVKIGINGEFGSDRSASMSNSNMGKGECYECSGTSVFDDKEKMKVQNESDSQKLKAAASDYNSVGTTSRLNKSNGNGDFASISSSSASFSFTCASIAKNSKDFGRYDENTKAQYSNLGLDGSNSHTSECHSRSGCGSRSACGTNPVVELSDEIKKLNIHAFPTPDGAYKCKSFMSSSCSQSDDIFVFRGSEGPSSSIHTSSTSHSHDKTKEDPLKTSGSNASKAESRRSDFGILDGCMENMVPNEVSSGSTDYDVHKNLGCSFEFLGKKRQPIDLNDKRFKGAVADCASPPYTFQAGLAKGSDATQCPQGQVNDDTEGKGSFKFISTPSGLGAHSMNPKTLKPEAPFSFNAYLFPGLNDKPDLSSKGRLIKDIKLKKKRGRARHPNSVKRSGKDITPEEGTSRESPSASGCYSPMDFSPYQETMADTPCSRETSATASKPFNLHYYCVPSAAPPLMPTDVQDEHLVATRESFAFKKGCNKGKEVDKGTSQYECEKQCFEPETSRQKSTTEQVCFSCGVDVASAEAGAGYGPNAEKQENAGIGQFFIDSTSESLSVKSFTFSASSPAQCHPSSAKHCHKKKNRLKGSHASNSINFSGVKFESPSFQFSTLASNPSLLDKAEHQKGDVLSKGEVKFEADEAQVKQQACEKWRLRGNKAYEHGRFSKAEDYYTKGVNSVLPGEALGCCLEPLVMCYSNRAAARMSLGRIREALGDCVMAVTLDPSFLKAHIRAANCHLMLGEVDEALRCFSKCVESKSDVCLDRRVTIEAFEGKEKAEKVDECIKRSTELLRKRTSDAAASALGVIAEAVSISSYSERLLEMKAEALYMLRKYEEVVHLCTQTITFAEINFDPSGINRDFGSIEIPECKSSLFLKLWRSRFICKCYFSMGKLEAALDLLEKQELAGSITEKFWNKKLDSSAQFAATIRELLRHKSAGNQAFQAGRYMEAVEHYTTALTMNVESRPFAAILFCNRGAAHQALGQLAGAIADCSIAIALDDTYQKAISRRAALHEKIRDHGQAASDLRKLISVLEKQSPGSPGVKEISQAQRRLYTIEEESKKGISLDLYLILGVTSSDDASEIKKAYRKAALKHHPDKAGQFLTRSGGGDDGQLWKEIIEEIHRDADRLFKMIGEAYAVLSDPVQRAQFDREEKIRNAPRENSNGYAQSSGTYYYPYQSSTNRRNWRGTYKTYGNSQSRW